jgi:hypothetical protein
MEEHSVMPTEVLSIWPTQSNSIPQVCSVPIILFPPVYTPHILTSLEWWTFPSVSLKILILLKARELYSISDILVHSSYVRTWILFMAPLFSFVSVTLFLFYGSRDIFGNTFYLITFTICFSPVLSICVSYDNLCLYCPLHLDINKMMWKVYIWDQTREISVHHLLAQYASLLRSIIWEWIKLRTTEINLLSALQLLRSYRYSISGWSTSGTESPIHAMTNHCKPIINLFTKHLAGFFYI